MILMLVVAAFVSGGLSAIGTTVAARRPNSWLVPVLAILGYAISGGAILFFWVKWWGSGRTMTFYNTIIENAPAEHHDIFSIKSLFWTLVYSLMYISIAPAVALAIWTALGMGLKALFRRIRKR